MTKLVQGNSADASLPRSHPGTEPRPARLTPEMTVRMARELALQLRKDGHIKDAEFEDSAADIAKVGQRHMDGYALAKALDEARYWDCDLTMAEALDAWSSLGDDEIKKAEQEWVVRNNIVPPYPSGTRVTIKGGEVGTLDDVYKYGIARYCVKMDDEKSPTTRRIVAFENVTPLEASSVPTHRDEPSPAQTAVVP